MPDSSIRNHLKKYFDAFERVLNDQFDLSTGASGGHIGALGENRERILIDFLEKHIPARFSIEQRGIVFDHQYNKSSQVDVLIYEHNYPKLGGQNPTLYFAEGVGGFIEVKSTLDKKTFTEAIKNVASVKRLKISPTDIYLGGDEPEDFFGGIFAFTHGDGFSSDVISEIVSESSLDEKLLPNFVYSNNGMFLLRKSNEFISQGKKDSKGDNLFHLLLYLSQRISGKNLVPISLEQYIK